ncbi:hypothetical protein V8E52_011897, partial [Russula decolorans]
LYAAIQEWRTGTQKSVKFSANAYLDVYNGHVNTFHHVRQNREDAFHLMMSHIYSHASAAAIGKSGAEIADIELDDIDN